MPGADLRAADKAMSKTDNSQSLWSSCSLREAGNMQNLSRKYVTGGRENKVGKQAGKLTTF